MCRSQAGSSLATLFVLVTALLASGCYTVRLEPIPPPANVTRVPLAASLDMPASTASYIYTARSGMAGFANTWTIEVGAALAQYADAYFSAAFPKGSDTVVRVDLEKFDVHNFEAHCDVRFTMTRHGNPAFQKAYHGRGTGYAARVVWGGAFAMKSALQRTTDEALRSVFEQFLKELEVQSVGAS